MKEQLIEYFENWPSWLQNLSIALGAILLGLIIKGIFKLIARNYSRKSEGYSLLRSISFHLGRPATYFFPLLLLKASIPFMYIGPRFEVILTRITTVLLIIAISAMLIAFINVLQEIVINRFTLHKEDNLRERKIRTQLQFLRKLTIALIITLAIIAILLTFESMRRLGAGLLTGVGVGGIIIGFAAQKSLGSLLAGMQIAFTQPIRIDDVLIVEGEWGRVEEITLTYVVINIWDKRRLILPINYFIEKPFQNWTRTTAEILGTVMFYLDYTAPIDVLKEEYYRLLATNPLWDKKAKAFEVTNITEKGIEIRALFGAANSGDAWQVRCFIREHMIKFIQANYPDCLPRYRFSEDPLQTPPQQPAS